MNNSVGVKRLRTITLNDKYLTPVEVIHIPVGSVVYITMEKKLFKGPGTAIVSGLKWLDATHVICKKMFQAVYKEDDDSIIIYGDPFLASYAAATNCQEFRTNTETPLVEGGYVMVAKKGSASYYYRMKRKAYNDICRLRDEFVQKMGYSLYDAEYEYGRFLTEPSASGTAKICDDDFENLFRRSKRAVYQLMDAMWNDAVAYVGETYAEKTADGDLNAFVSCNGKVWYPPSYWLKKQQEEHFLYRKVQTVEME